MDVNQRILSDITVFMKYARYLPELNRRETWTELVNRNKNMHLRKFPQLRDEIEAAYAYVYAKKVLPSMRSLQFAGPPIEIGNQRMYNCCALPVDHYKAFSETLFLLLSGTGVGYSVQYHHVAKLDPIVKPTKTHKFVIEDSIAGWADAVKALMKSYFTGKSKPRFDFSDIRPKGMRLVTSGGKAPGPEPLKICLTHVESILERKQNGEKLTPLECHDIMCHLADAVLSGGIRRAALISLFSFDDEEMLTCKYGNWWELNPQRSRANNSAIVVRSRIKKDEFKQLWKKIELSNSGEPGISWSNNPEYLYNPCVIGDTRLLTNKGFVTIEHLSQIYKTDTDIKVITADKNGKLTASTLEWCGVTQKDDKIYKIAFENGQYQLTNLKHKFYLPDFEQISVAEIQEKLKTEEIYLQGYKRLVKVVSVEDAGIVEDVYDLTANPNYNFFAVYNHVVTSCYFKIDVNGEKYYPLDVINIGEKTVFAKDLYNGDGGTLSFDQVQETLEKSVLNVDCHEISLRENTFCNLVEINSSTIESEQDFYDRCKIATFISTLQASYTDFYYLRQIWKQNTEKDALIGVGITGISSMKIENEWLKRGTDVVLAENERVAKIIGINTAARSTTVKPSGTSSLVLGTSSGIHAWHNDFYIRRIRVNKNESIYPYLKNNHPHLIEDEYFRPHDTAVITIPQKAPAGAVVRTESVFDLLERVKTYNENWVYTGHRRGPNKNNVSATISIKADEWDAVGEWMWQNRDSYSGISVLPYDGGTYIQAPFEDITEARYLELSRGLGDIDLSMVIEDTDNTDLSGEAACAGGLCEIV